MDVSKKYLGVDFLFFYDDTVMCTLTDAAQLVCNQEEAIQICIPTSKICELYTVDSRFIGISINASDEEKLGLLKKFVIQLYTIAEQTKRLDYETVMSEWEKLRYPKQKKSMRTIIKRYGSGEPVQTRTIGQERYVRAIENHLITFGIGAAGTGKTFLAIAEACRSLKNHDVEKIILARPVVEAGENLGFLPGDIQEKIDPYMQPLYDALYDILGKPNVDMYIQKGIIRIAPLAYMRGCTFTNSFIILDEAQNATQEQLRMFLTRFGENSRMVVECDPTQIDLPKKHMSCIGDITLFENILEIAICRFTENDIIRHPVIKKIIQAYKKK